MEIIIILVCLVMGYYIFRKPGEKLWYEDE